MVVSYGRTRLIRRAALACLAFATFMAMLQISRYARRPPHFSSPSSSHNYNHLSSDGQQQETEDISTATTTSRTPESLRADLNEYWGNLKTKTHHLVRGDDDDLAVSVQRIIVPSFSASSSSSLKGSSGWVKSKSNFLPAHGFVRPRFRQDNNKEGDDEKKEKEKEKKKFYWPLSGPLTLPPLPLPFSPKRFKSGTASSSSSSSSPSSHLLLGVATCYPRISFSDFRMITDSWKQSLSSLGGGAGAGLIVALENGTEEERIQVRDALYRSGIVDASVFVPQSRTDTYKGNVHAQLFQQMMMARFGVGEMGAGKARRWFGIMDQGARFVGEGLVEGLDGVFGREEEDDDGVSENGNGNENGRWYIGFSSVKEDWWVGNTTKGGNEKIYRRGGGGGGGEEAVMLMSQSVLDTAGQLMCFQGGGKGLSREQQKMTWNELLYECLMQGDKDLKYHVLGDGGPRPADEDGQAKGEGNGEESLPQRPLVIKDTGIGLVDVDVPPAVLFEDYWVVRPGEKITYYPNGVEVKEKINQGSKKTEGKKVSERVILHSPFPPGTKPERLVWKGKTKTWELLDTETRQHEGRQEVWQAYVNKKGGNGQESEELSSADSVVILIWEVGKKI